MRKVYASCPCCHQRYWTGEFTKGRGPSGVTVALVGVLDAALSAITSAESLDQARGIAHAALHREEYDA